MSAQILVVEKNEKIGGLICAQLREKGHEVRDCRNGPEAGLELRNAMEIIGKAVFKFRFADQYAKVPDLVESENISILKAEYELLGIMYADCGGELAIHWDLPGEVRTAITSHHQPGQST